MPSHQERLRRRLEAMPFASPPFPWRQVSEASVGGLLGVGYVGKSDDLLVVSGQGRGLFDCLTGERIARDSDALFENTDESELTAPGIGKHLGVVVPIAGLEGGGLALGSRDGWRIDAIALSWPVHLIFLTSDYGSPADERASTWKIGSDEPCELRAAGFSPTGGSFVVATSCELKIYARS